MGERKEVRTNVCAVNFLMIDGNLLSIDNLFVASNGVITMVCIQTKNLQKF
jgi:hypothetical protein